MRTVVTVAVTSRFYRCFYSEETLLLPSYVPGMVVMPELYIWAPAQLSCLNWGFVLPNMSILSSLSFFKILLILHPDCSFSSSSLPLPHPSSFSV